MKTQEEIMEMTTACVEKLTPLLNEKSKSLGDPREFDFSTPDQLAAFITQMTQDEFQHFTTLVMLAEMGLI